MSDIDPPGPQHGEPQEPYRVGPGRPPLSTRWKKGDPSPNPLGRPPKKRSEQGLFHVLDPFAAVVLEFDNQLVTKRTPEGEVDITRRQASLEKLFKEAMGGNYRALVYYQKITQAAQTAEHAHRLDLATKALEYRDMWMTRFLYAEKKGQPLPLEFPDPRDIEIGPDMSVTICGPTDLEGRVLQDRVVAERDEFIRLAASLKEDRGGLSVDEAAQITRRLKRLIAKYNRVLPPRLQRKA